MASFGAGGLGRSAKTVTAEGWRRGLWWWAYAISPIDNTRSVPLRGSQELELRIEQRKGVHSTPYVAAAHPPDVLPRFRMGGFYKSFCEDAQSAGGSSVICSAEATMISGVPCKSFIAPVT